MMILSPSLLGADFKHLEEEIARVKKGGAKYLHLDVMDGAFVPSISFGMPVLSSIRNCTDLVFDVHMMVEEPARYVEDIRKAGADIITIHAEACRHLDSSIETVKKTGAKVGLALNPATPIETIDLVLPKVDMVLIMLVNPGFGGQKLIPYAVEKVRALRKRCEELGLQMDIEVDGGVNLKNVREIAEAGANVLVAGSAVFGGDAEENSRKFMEILKDCEA